MSLVDILAELLFPGKCVFCERVLPRGEREVCPACRKSLPYRRAGEKTTGFVAWVASPLYYEGKVKDSLHRYKFGGRAHYAGSYAALMAETLAERRDDYDLISHVPLHPARRRQRGYDQAEELARELSGRRDVEWRPLLKKLRNAPPQSRTGDATARRANISGCYGLLEGAAAEGRRVLLVDDIFTTGATMSECARILKMHGAAEVCGAVVACSRGE